MTAFTPDSLHFLFENRLQNSREWYAAHKADYERLVRAPFRELIQALTPTMLEIDPKILTDPARVLSRVARDVRFIRDGMLYRDTAWFIFIRDKKLYQGLPGYFFQISPDEISWGCGYYQASTRSMEQFRKLVLRGDPDFVKARDSLENLSGFVLEGDLYKRSKFPAQPPELRRYLDRKSLCAIHTSTDWDFLFSDQVAGRLKKDFIALTDWYLFLMKVEEETGAANAE